MKGFYVPVERMSEARLNAEWDVDIRRYYHSPCLKCLMESQTCAMRLLELKDA